VHVHVRAGAGAGLVGVHRELVVVLPGDHGIRGGDDRVGDGAVQHAEILVGAGGGLLRLGGGVDVRGLQALAGDGEVLPRALGLCPVQRGGGDAHLTHGVVLDPVPLCGRGLVHDVASSGRDANGRGGPAAG